MNKYDVRMIRNEDESAKIVIMASSFDEAIEKFDNEHSLDWLDWEVVEVRKDLYYEAI